MKYLITIFLLAIFTSTAFAAQTSCADLVKECFAYTNSERAECFLASGKHNFCEGSVLGELALKRWSMAPDSFSKDEDSKNLMGPDLVDPACINNFDNQFSSALIKAEPNADTLKTLSSSLDTCKKQLPEEIMRP